MRYEAWKFASYSATRKIQKEIISTFSPGSGDPLATSTLSISCFEV